MARAGVVLAVLGVAVPACRRDYEVLGLEDGDPSADGLTGIGGTLGNGGSAGDPGTGTDRASSIDAGGAGSAVTSSTESGGAPSTGEATGVDTTTTGAASTTTDGSGGDAGAATTTASSATTTASSATTTASSATTTASSAGMGGTGGLGAGGAATTTAGATTTGSATTTNGVGGVGGGGTGGTGGGTGSDADLASGYWLLDASDTAGKDWRPSTLVVTSTTPNPDGTTDLTYRLDWFETAAGFGVLLGGEEIGVGNYDPLTSSLILTQTGGFASESLDVYEADYDATTDTLSGFWDTGTPGTFNGARRLDGTLLPAPTAVASSTQNGTSASNTVDADMFTEWSSSNGGTVGETLTLTLVAPATLRGLRLMALVEGNAGIPARLRVSSRDSGGNEVDLSDVVVPSDPMWNPIPLAVDAAVAEVHIEIIEVVPAGSNRVMISGVELFGTP